MRNMKELRFCGASLCRVLSDICTWKARSTCKFSSDHFLCLSSDHLSLDVSGGFT